MMPYSMEENEVVIYSPIIGELFTDLAGKLVNKPYI